MEWEPVLILGVAGAAVLGLLLCLAILFLMVRLGGLSDEVRRFSGQQDTMHLTVKERLDEVTRTVGDGLTQSHTTIGQIHERLAVIDEAQKRFTDLGTQVVSLQEVLTNKQARGAFGEVQLQDLVEQALPPSAYSLQHTLSNGKRADCLIILPNPPGPIAIDAKFPLESYRALREAKNDAGRVSAGRAFSRDVSKHINDIAERYIVPEETAESALLFLPSEAVYAELHANFPATVEESYRRRVWIVSPTTLMATLNTVRAILRDVRMREQAHLIRDETLKLLDDVRRLDERVTNLNRHFEQAGKDVREIGISADKIISRGERIRDVDMEVANEQDAAVGKRDEPELPVGLGRM
jgi:DNA recombination protein RmuC